MSSKAIWHFIRGLGCYVGIHSWSSAATRGEMSEGRIRAATAFGEDVMTRLMQSYLLETCLYCDSRIEYVVGKEDD